MFMMPFQYLNTVIPYEKKSVPPSVEDLQMLTNSKLLFGLRLTVSRTKPWVLVLRVGASHCYNRSWRFLTQETMMDDVLEE